jgi:Carboxypeptidase regulatory-like domain
MKPLMIGLGAWALWAATALDAAAAWDNIYQPTLFGRCHKQTTTQYYTPPAVVYSSPVVAASPACNTCTPCPQQQCSTSYTQRCFYTPVTTMTTQSYYEAVTTMQTSYYYEPVTTCRTSCYYDPCTCSYQQVSTPVTSLELRARSCPVQSWVQRCAQVPVTTMQKSCYWEPKTTCCQTTTGPLIPIGGAGAPPAVYGGTAPAPGNPPSIIASPPGQTGPPPVIDQNAPIGPNGGKTSFSNPPQWQAPANYVPQSNPQPQVRLERIVFGPESYVEGQIVRADQSPKGNASVLFVSADNGKRETVTANDRGRFQVTLASGNWLVYVQGRDGTAQFHSQLRVQEQQTARITLVN